MKDDQSGIKHAIDAISAFFTVGALLNFITAWAAVMSIIWYSIRIWESDTVRAWTNRPRPERDFVDTITMRRRKADAERK